jgi:AcrR family transcriptional regulator
VTRCGDDVAAIAADGRTLVAQQGVERFRLEDVGERAGDSRAAPAKYYRDKAGLLSPPFFTSSVC